MTTTSVSLSKVCNWSTVSGLDIWLNNFKTHQIIRNNVISDNFIYFCLHRVFEICKEILFSFHFLVYLITQFHCKYYKLHYKQQKNHKLVINRSTHENIFSAHRHQLYVYWSKCTCTVYTYLRSWQDYTNSCH